MNAYIESKKAEAKQYVETTIEAAMDIAGLDRQAAIEAVKKACQDDYSKSRGMLNGFSKFDSDERVNALRDQVFIKRLMVKYAETL